MGRLLSLYRVMMSCRKAPPEFRFASSTLRNFVPSGAAHEAAAGHALSEPSDNYPATCINGFSTTIIMLCGHNPRKEPVTRCHKHLVTGYHTHIPNSQEVYLSITYHNWLLSEF